MKKKGIMINDFYFGNPDCSEPIDKGDFVIFEIGEFDENYNWKYNESGDMIFLQKINYIETGCYVGRKNTEPLIKDFNEYRKDKISILNNISKNN